MPNLGRRTDARMQHFYCFQMSGYLVRRQLNGWHATGNKDGKHAVITRVIYLCRKKGGLSTGRLHSCSYFSIVIVIPRKVQTVTLIVSHPELIILSTKDEE